MEWTKVLRYKMHIRWWVIRAVTGYMFSTTFPAIKWDSSTIFPWENRKLLTINTFTSAVHSEAIAGNSNTSLLLGPLTLRKSSVSASIVASILLPTFGPMASAPTMNGSLGNRNFMLPQYNTNSFIVGGGVNSSAGEPLYTSGNRFMSSSTGDDFISNGNTGDYDTGAIRRTSSSVGGPATSTGIGIANNVAGKRRSSVVALAATANAANRAAKQRSLAHQQGDGNYGSTDLVSGDDDTAGSNLRAYSIEQSDNGKYNGVGNLGTNFSASSMRDSFMKPFANGVPGIGSSNTSLNGAGNGAGSMAPTSSPSGAPGSVGGGSAWGKLSSMMKTTMQFKGK
jgi:hypothetical protein